MTTNTLPIVGAFFRPPAKALIEVLAIGTPLFLIAEPDNPYDSNAIAVFLESANIPISAHPILEETLPPFGFSIEQILSQDAWHLGYVPKEMAAKITAQGILGSDPYPVTFSTSANGGPRVRSTEPFDV